MTESAIKTEELKNDDVKVVVRRHPHCRIELEVTGTEKLVKKAEKEALKAVKKEVSLPGFRKGKAPEDLIEKKFPEAIQEKTNKTIADLSFAAAMGLVKIQTLNNNAPINFNVNKLSPTEAILTFSFETEPQPPAIDISKFKLRPVEKPEVGEKELNEAIRQMQMFYAKWTPVTDRKVQEGDFLILDLQTIEEAPKKVFSDTRFEVSDDHMAKWMKKLVLGKETVAAVEGFSEPDSDLSEEKKKEFAPKRVLLTIKKIETVQLPELNDDFAKKVGAKSLEEMKRYIQQMLASKAEEKVDRETREQVNEFLLAHPFDMPLSLINKEKEHRRKQLIEDPRYQAKLQQMTDLERDMEKLEMEEAIQNQSDSAVRLFYASRQLVREKNIPVSYEEVQMEAVNTVKAFGPLRVDPNSIPEEAFALALSKLILAKAQDYILQNAKK